MYQKASEEENTRRRLLVTKRNEIVYNKAFGTSNATTKLKPNAIFRLALQSKGHYCGNDALGTRNLG
jgi:hypothetical protein